jgi:DNA-binding MarR family transcriptional regulator
VSRIVHAFAAADALTIERDGEDRRRVRVELAAGTHEAILARAGNRTEGAIAARTPRLGDAERELLEHHLDQAAALLRRGARP